jgi:hypothetical protein
MLKEILSISGKPGLFKLVSSSNSSLIVESLIDGKRFPTYASAQVIALDDIAIYTEDEDRPLRDIFKTIAEKTNGEKAISHKESANAIKAFMLEVIPDYDQSRVYVSDMKKLFQWYNLLHDKGMLKFDEKEKTDEK